MSTINSTTYRANGKLLLTGEYLVLKGAKALAVPLKFGQGMKLIANGTGLTWQATNLQQNWFEARYDEQFRLLSATDKVLGGRLEEIFRQISILDPSALTILRNKTIQTELDFNRNWGWGSSSTLIALLSQVTGVDPYRLLEQTFGGSGYDIACALSDGPLVYQRLNEKTCIQNQTFNPVFNKHIFFIYSGKKQNSQNEVARFNKEALIEPNTINIVNCITDDLIKCDNLYDFGDLMDQHEQIIGSIVQQIPIKIEHFSNFEGSIKTLGAWGGDFMMAVSPHDQKYIEQYFGNKGLNTIFTFNDIVLNA